MNFFNAHRLGTSPTRVVCDLKSAPTRHDAINVWHTAAQYSANILATFGECMRATPIAG